MGEYINLFRDVSNILFSLMEKTAEISVEDPMICAFRNKISRIQESLEDPGILPIEKREPNTGVFTAMRNLYSDINRALVALEVYMKRGRISKFFTKNKIKEELDSIEEDIDRDLVLYNTSINEDTRRNTEVLIKTQLGRIKRINTSRQALEKDKSELNLTNLCIDDLKLKEDITSSDEVKAIYNNMPVIIRKYGSFHDPNVQITAFKEIAFINTLRNCPNILKCYGRFLKDDIMYVVTEDLENDDLTLETAILSGRLSRRQKRTVFTQLTSAVAIVHGVGIILKYLNSNNIFLDEYNTPKLSDVRDGRVVGHPTVNTVNTSNCVKWEAPEVYNPSKTSGFQADVYSLGIILWELITGKTPFENIEDEDEIMDIKESKDEIIKMFNIPGHKLNSLIINCLSPDPEERPKIIQLQINADFIFK